MPPAMIEADEAVALAESEGQPRGKHHRPRSAAPLADEEDHTIDLSLRPRSLSEFTGQPRIK
ncbi:MAG TPA: hypothetical protein VNU00_05745, partial [Candidatus Binataceae bacterium]|nr:hypothetical protein [Candidatus Binataceae bacterium]